MQVKRIDVDYLQPGNTFPLFLPGGAKGLEGKSQKSLVFL